VSAGRLTYRAGAILTLVRWWPGYMSAPHTYVTDRLCVVVSGTWWCNSGDDFDPPSCVPPPPVASFAASPVHRITMGPQPCRAGDYRNLRHGTGWLQAGGPIEAGVAAGVVILVRIGLSLIPHGTKLLIRDVRCHGASAGQGADGQILSKLDPTWTRLTPK
jgi:hypothetical protein